MIGVEDTKQLYDTPSTMTVFITNESLLLNPLPSTIDLTDLVVIYTTYSLAAVTVIVSEEAVINSLVRYEGIKFVLTDTAGVRTSNDEVEKIGIEKAKQSINYADIILAVFDNNQELEQLDYDIFNLIKDKNYIVIVNKCDLYTKINLPCLKASNPFSKSVS